MALTWALILLLSYLCELGKLWTQTSYLTSFGLRVLSVKREQWHLVELGWDSPQPASLCWAQEKDCQAEGKRGPAPSGRFPRVLHMPASSLLPLPWPWPGFLTLWPQCIPTAASQHSVEFFQCLQCQLYQSSPLRHLHHKRHGASKPRILGPWGSSDSIREQRLPQRPECQPHQAVLQAPSFNNSTLYQGGSAAFWNCYLEWLSFHCELFQLPT